MFFKILTLSFGSSEKSYLMLELLGGEDSNFTFSNITEKRARREERGGGNEILFYVIEYGIMFVICARERARVERIVSTPRQIARRVNEWVEQSMFLSFDPLVCFGRDDMTNMLVTSISEDSRGGGEEGKRKHREEELIFSDGKSFSAELHQFSARRRFFPNPLSLRLLAR
jgi:hypothetical protein